MINNKKLAGVILAGVLTVAGTMSAFAADQTGISQQFVNQKKPAKMDFSKMSTTIKSSLDSLVSAGTITQAQADAVLKAYTPVEGKGIVQRIRRNPMEELVTAGTITQAQADAINTALKAGRESKKTTEDVLKDMVTAGTITQAQADAVSKCFNPQGRKFVPMNINKNPISQLISAGTITQAQADAINSAVKTGITSKRSMEDIFKGLVAAGTITETQKEAVMKAFPDKLRMEKFKDRGEHKGPLDNLITAGTITQAQADAYITAIKSGREAKKSPADILKEMVTAGTITQAQADAIQKPFPKFERKDESRMLRKNPLDEVVSAGIITQAQADAINAAIKSNLNSFKKL